MKYLNIYILIGILVFCLMKVLAKASKWETLEERVSELFAFVKFRHNHFTHQTQNHEHATLL